MKKALPKVVVASILAAATAAGTPLLTLQAHAAETTSTITLQVGSSGTLVSELQANLKTLGFFTYPSITGYYGTITADAVRAFQTAYSLPVTGMADASTRSVVSFALVRKKLVADTYNYLRVPYLWGGTTPTGFDCSGFVYFMFNKHGVSMPRTNSATMATMGKPVDRARLVPGDLVFFALGTPGVVSHVGFYVGNGEFISATNSAGIYVQRLDSSYWGPKYMGARRY